MVLKTHGLRKSCSKRQILTVTVWFAKKSSWCGVPSLSLSRGASAVLTRLVALNRYCPLCRQPLGLSLRRTWRRRERMHACTAESAINPQMHAVGGADGRWRRLMRRWIGRRWCTRCMLSGRRIDARAPVSATPYHPLMSVH